MALVKPKLGDDVLQTDIDQTEAINDNSTKIVSIEQDLLSLETKLSKDYIVDYGRNEFGSWEKWESGKLVIYGLIEGSVDANQTTTISHTLPVPNIAEYEATVITEGLRSASGNYNQVEIKRIWKVNNDVINVAVVSTRNEAQNVSVSYNLIGRWK